MLALYSATLLLGAALLFAVQPLVARMVLPMFGGAPGVWNACVLFFQVALLAGYGYAHWGPRRLGVRRHAVVHLGLLAAAGAGLPIGVAGGWAPREGVPPVLWLLWLLTATVGLPFFVLAATAPLVQRWLAATAHRSAGDPYFLYAASNGGSMLALVGYPLLLERLWTVEQQSRLWLGGYVLLVALLAGCAVSLRRAAAPAAEPSPGAASASRPGWALRLRWLALAFVPSSLMLSVTTYLTTDIAALPLFWVTPLALYLLTFILAFARRPPVPHRLAQRLVPLVVLVLALVLLSEATELRGVGVWPLMALHLLGLVVVSLACHGELALRRPAPAHLTGFYLWLALGGGLGGAFNALAAPILFTDVAEYPLVLVAACLLAVGRMGGGGARRALRRDVPPALALGLLVLGLGFVARSLVRPADPESFQLVTGLAFGPAIVVCYTFIARPLRFALGVGALFLVGSATGGVHGERLLAERSFFGIHRVTTDAEGRFYRLVHGNTVHGLQSREPREDPEPLAYYHRQAPIGRVFAALEESGAPPREVGVVGLGVGSLAAYGREGQRWTFYEIDPAVVELARGTPYFTFWSAAERAGVDLSVVVGDARLRLAAAEEARYDLLVVDAFSSDAVPVHLVTREALALYRSRLAPAGLLAFHISNRYVDLEPVMAELAADAGLRCLGWARTAVSERERRAGAFGSHWVVMGRSGEHLDGVEASGPWRRLAGGRPRFLWTDRFSNVLGVLRWGGGAEA